MRRHLARPIVALAVSLAALSVAARAPAAPTDIDDFTASVAQKFAKVMPEAQIKVKGPLDLEITIDGKPQQTRLVNIWGYCQRDASRCDRTVDDFLANMAGTMKEAGEEITPADIRAVVRQEGYIAETRKVSAKNPDVAVIARPLAGDLWLMCVVDHPHGVQLLNHGNVAKLKLSEDEAILLALRNVAEKLPPLSEEADKLKGTKEKMIAGDFYGPSRILLHDQWAAMARRMKGHLIVAVPATDMLIYGSAGTDKQINKFREIVAFAASKAPRPVSITLLRWTEEGWDVVAP